MTWTRTLLAVAAALATASAAAPAQAAQHEPGAFAARPSKEAPQDKRGTYFRLHMERGTDRRQSVVVQNLSKNTKHLLVDAVDGLTGTTSGAVYANRDDPRTRASTWVRLPMKSIDVPAGREVRIPFSLTIPDDARTGDHLAGIAIQDRHRTRSGSRLSVTQTIRVVVGVQIIVDGPREKALQLGKIALQPLPGTKVPSVVVHLENTGTQLCKPQLEVDLAGADDQHKLVTRELDTILPGTAIDFPLPWPTALQSGKYALAVQAKRCGDPVAVQASAELGSTLLGTPDRPEPAATTTVVRSASVPWIGIVGLLILVAFATGGGVALYFRRRLPDA